SHYYATQQPFGKDGDFITAPEISQMFGEVIGAWIVYTWQQKKEPKFNLVEIGGGRGTLMHDILRSTQVFKSFHQALDKVYMVETSPTLAKLQQAKLQDFQPIIIADVEQLSGTNNIVLCNEFFDALPIKQFHSKTNQERKIINDHGLKFNFAEDDIIETSPATLAYASKIADKIKSGFGLIIDYGYVQSPQKSTLQAVKNHQFHDPLKDVGQADITALVDFSALSEVFTSRGFTTQITTQREFLIANGILERADRLLKSLVPPQRIEQDLDRLIGKSQMGELFKVLEINIW
ncbi:MAG: class I SAM-dependent methyltransferase, partial [Rickettsiales bacterium]